jgi:phage/plasmid-like protein (TIGR03299 family)
MQETIAKDNRKAVGQGAPAAAKTFKAKDLVRDSELAWKVGKVGLVTVDGRPVPGKMASVREDTGKVLGVVGDGWTPVQNERAFDFLDAVCDGANVSYESAKSWMGGRLVHVQLKVNGYDEVAKGDAVARYITVTNRHDGLGAFRGFGCDVRIVCMNTLLAAIAEAEADESNKIICRLAHTLNVEARIDAAVNLLKADQARHAKFMGMARFLAGEQVKPSAVDEFLKRLEIEVSGKESGQSVKDRRVAKVKELFETGRGNQLPSVKGSWWALYNSVTEYVDHFAEVKQGGHESREDARAYAALYGHTAGLKREALSVALSMASKQ